VIPGVIWDQYPWPPLDAKETIAAAGLDIEENPAVGILPGPWKGHPRNALVISPTINISIEEFAISNESLDSVLASIAEEARRRK
jgi:hypothetical protein